MALTEPGRLPTEDELLWDDGVPMENMLHGEQASFYLKQPLERYHASRGVSSVVGTNAFVYFDPARPPVGPDLYVVLGAKPRRRKGWAAWLEEGMLPQVVVELLSPSTEAQDRGRKFLLYRDVLQVAEYYLFDHDEGRLEGFRRESGVYVSLPRGPLGRLECRTLGLWLGVHEGWLRWFEPDGSMLPTAAEEADAERHRADAERQRADAERLRAEDLEREVARLREEVRRARPE